MKWNNLKNVEQLEQIDEESKTLPVLIFKYSSICGVSSMVLNRLETKWKDEYITLFKPYFLDLIAYRKISNEVASHYGVTHESPQVILISGGISIYHNSHSGIRLEEIVEEAAQHSTKKS